MDQAILDVLRLGAAELVEDGFAGLVHELYAPSSSPPSNSGDTANLVVTVSAAAPAQVLGATAALEATAYDGAMIPVGVTASLDISVYPGTPAPTTIVAGVTSAATITVYAGVASAVLGVSSHLQVIAHAGAPAYVPGATSHLEQSVDFAAVQVESIPSAPGATVSLQVAVGAATVRVIPPTIVQGITLNAVVRAWAGQADLIAGSLGDPIRPFPRDLSAQASKTIHLDPGSHWVELLFDRVTNVSVKADGYTVDTSIKWYRGIPPAARVVATLLGSAAVGVNAFPQDAGIPYYLLVEDGAARSVQMTAGPWAPTARITIPYIPLGAPTPGWVVVKGTGFHPYELISLQVVDGPSDTARAGIAGKFALAFQFPLALPIGTHIMTASGDKGSTAVHTFQTIAGFGSIPGDPGSDPGDPPTPPVGFQRWVMGSYTFERNPVAMTSSHPPRNYTVDRTIDIAGQPVIWESGPRPWPWKFSGIGLTSAFHAALVSAGRARDPFWLVDHRGRSFLLVFTNVDIRPRTFRKTFPGDDHWLFDYEVEALIYERRT